MVTNTVIQQLVERIKQFDPEKIILFGSYAYGTPSDQSDVDLFVVKNVRKEDIRDLRLSIRKHLRDIIYKQKVPVDLLLDSQENVNERIKLGDSIYEEIMNKGRTVYAK
ncbi:MAG: nucleotidyltransferase domain-containing protein [Bacteroidia bacterium]|nr:nucleotidyltransferase domain-containing protein [Bacteroidia bacterium]